MRHPSALALLPPLLAMLGCGAATVETGVQHQTGPEPSAIGDEALASIERSLIEKHGEAQAERIRLGLRQVSQRWHDVDGDAEALRALAEEHFVADQDALADTARHLEYALEMLDGHANEVERELSSFQDLDEGPLQPVDTLLATYSASAHVNEDLFKNKVAFVVLLNFPITTLEQRLAEGKGWSREQWALARLAGRFEHRLPADVAQEIQAASAGANRYIDNYNIAMDRLAGPTGPVGFEKGQTLISHWGLRDEIRALYGDAGGLEKQRLIATVMERIIRQEIPADVVDSDELEWDPARNLVRTPGGGEWRAAPREADARYEQLLRVFHAIRRADAYFPELPTHIDRAFERDREMPEKRVRALLESVLLSDTARRVGDLIKARLGRPLEPFDIWYDGFRPGSEIDQAELDQRVRSRYPDARSFHADVPRILGQLGFDEETAGFLAEHIVVEPARGAGHALGARRREDNAHLRTRVGAEGMDYKGFNIAVHELGHNVEQVFSMSRIDHTLLEGVPNTGFTEAIAFLFQQHDLELLGLSPPTDSQAESLRALDRFWMTYEISGVAILDMEIWHWMYEHPDATPAELREATLVLARQVWNRYYAPVFGVRDVVLPAIYSHIVAYGLYTPDYPLGFVITSQVESYVRSRSLAQETERMCRLGRLTPDAWMEQAVGAGVSTDSVIAAADEALAVVGQASPAGR